MSKMKMVLVNVKIDADVLIPKSWLKDLDFDDGEAFFGVGTEIDKLYWADKDYPNGGGVKEYYKQDYKVITEEMEQKEDIKHQEKEFQNYIRNL